jgi:hypothetical protein
MAEIKRSATTRSGKKFTYTVSNPQPVSKPQQLLRTNTVSLVAFSIGAVYCWIGYFATGCAPRSLKPGGTYQNCNPGAGAIIAGVLSFIVIILFVHRIYLKSKS